MAESQPAEHPRAVLAVLQLPVTGPVAMAATVAMAAQAETARPVRPMAAMAATQIRSPAATVEVVSPRRSLTLDSAETPILGLRTAEQAALVAPAVLVLKATVAMRTRSAATAMPAT